MQEQNTEATASFETFGLRPEILRAVAGMKYAVLTAKHVAGHCLWPSRHTPYTVANSTDRTDVCLKFVDACRKKGVLPGFYYCSWDNHNRFGSRTPSDEGATWVDAVYQDDNGDWLYAPGYWQWSDPSAPETAEPATPAPRTTRSYSSPPRASPDRL